jgi:Serine carboxypeptidase S28
VGSTISYSQRYYANDEFYQDGGPIFIFVGGEWAISPGWATNGHMVDMAREMNGYVFYTEHRFYGQSKPTRLLFIKCSVLNLLKVSVNFSVTYQLKISNI